MKYVMLHGRAQAGKDKGALKASWIQAFNKGRQALNSPKPNVNDGDVLFPFYGDALEELIAKLEMDDDSVVKRGVDPDDPILAIKYAIASEFAANLNLDKDAINQEYTGKAIERGPENWEWVQGLLRVLDRTKVGDWSVSRFTRDTAVYLHYPAVRKAINQLVVESVGAEECMWITHSMGTIIAYDILSKNSQIKAPKLATLGSPLGIKAIKRHLQSPLAMPLGVGHWTNFYDERDLVPLYPLSKASGWDIKPPIDSKVVTNLDANNPHSFAGYLAESTFAAYID